MFVAFISTVAMSATIITMAFSQGQENPTADNFLDSQTKVFVDDRSYGVDEVN